MVAILASTVGVYRRFYRNDHLSSRSRMRLCGTFMTELEKIIRPIVEGQIRGFIKEHPSILSGVDWYKPRQDRAVTLTNSLTKRIVRDLTCGMTAARLAAAFAGTCSGDPPNGDVARCGGAPPPGAGIASLAPAESP